MLFGFGCLALDLALDFGAGALFFFLSFLVIGGGFVFAVAVFSFLCFLLDGLGAGLGFFLALAFFPDDLVPMMFVGCG